MISIGLVTPTVLKAGAAFVAPDNLGNAIGSGGSQGIDTVIDEETNLEIELSLNNLILQINTLTSQNWYQRLTEFLQNFESATTDQLIIDSWNNIANEDGVFFDILGIYEKTAQDILGPSIVSGNFNTPLQLIPDWIAATVVGDPPNISTETGIINSINGNIQKFSSVFTTSESYVLQQNQYINSVSALRNVENTFVNMDNWITSGITGVTTDTNAFGQDLEKTGRLLNLGELTQIGNPGQLINRLSQTNALGIIADKLEEKNIGVSEILASQGPTSPVLLKELYNALTELDGRELESIKKVLQIKTKGLETVADLLDPKKIFPNSYLTLTSPIFGSTVAYKLIYSDTSGGLSQEFNGLGGTLRSITSPEIAAANAALARSLGQITNIFSVSVSDFAKVLQSIETLDDIDLIQNQPELVEENVEDIWFDESSTIDLGTGANGKLLLADLLGISFGYNIVAPLKQNIELYSELDSRGAFLQFTKKGSSNDPSIGFFQVIEYLFSGEYTEFDMSSYTITIPSGVKGEGTYESDSLNAAIRMAWFDGIYPELLLSVKNIVNDNFEIANAIINNSKRWQTHRAREFTNRSRLLEPDFFELPSSREDSLRFAQQLPQRALDTTLGGANQLLEGIADRSTEGGQALIAALRESRNIDRIESIGISANSFRTPSSD